MAIIAVSKTCRGIPLMPSSNSVSVLPLAGPKNGLCLPGVFPVQRNISGHTNNEPHHVLEVELGNGGDPEDQIQSGFLGVSRGYC